MLPPLFLRFRTRQKNHISTASFFYDFAEKIMLTPFLHKKMFSTALFSVRRSGHFFRRETPKLSLDLFSSARSAEKDFVYFKLLSTFLHCFARLLLGGVTSFLVPLFYPW